MPGPVMSRAGLPQAPPSIRWNDLPQLQYLGRYTCSYCGAAMKVEGEECPTELIDDAARELESS